MDDASMDSDEASMVSDDVVDELEVPVTQNLAKRKRTFSQAQRACLNAFFTNGMTGCSKQHAALINQASRDAELTIKQVKVKCS